MGSNFQKCTFSRDWCRADLEPTRKYIVEGQSLLESGTERWYCWEVVVGHMLYNAKSVVNYETMNSYMLYMGIQANLYRRCDTNQRTTEQCAARKVLHDFEMKRYFSCWHLIDYFLTGAVFGGDCDM